MCADTFRQQLLEVLRAHPGGISEYDLIKLLEASGEPGFEASRFRDNLSLFQTHFLLFHSLYRLGEQLFREGEYRLEIGPLRIQLLPQREAPDSALATHDPLRSYYLDLSNLENTDAETVDALLARFWMRFVGNDERRAALETLELEEPTDWAAIKRRHRELVMEHHPDRGGDKERLQEINAAMEVLARAYQRP
jgi:hypothetical protein